MIKCLNCGKKNSDENKFCGECGYPLPAPQNYCPECDVTFKKGEKFCTQCGHVLVNEVEYFIELERLEEQRLKEQKLRQEKEYMEKLKNENPKKYDELKSRSETDKETIEEVMGYEIDDEAYLKWSKDNNISETKDEFIKDCTNLASEYQIDAYVHTIHRYEKLINNKQKLEEYNTLFKLLKNDSIRKLRKYKNLKYRKGLLLLEYVEQYSIEEIFDIINNFD